ncbi:MAG: hypothetical protein R3C61_21950 [Bacteroidia bacterium]
MSCLDLAGATKANEATLSRTLEELIECDFISIFLAISQKKKDSPYPTDLYSLLLSWEIYSAQQRWKGTKKSGNNLPPKTIQAWSGYTENICMMAINQIKSALGIRVFANDITHMEI